jgi:WD40 repeat protein
VRGHTAPIHAVAFAPGGVAVATASTDGTVRLWGATTGRCVAVLRTEGLGAHTLAFSANGRSLAAAGAEQVLWVWDVSGVAGPPGLRRPRRAEGGRRRCRFRDRGPGVEFTPWSSPSTMILGILDAISGAEDAALVGRKDGADERSQEQLTG